MSPAIAVARFQARHFGGRLAPGMVCVATAVALAVPPTWVPTMVMLGFTLAVSVPWSSLNQPSTAERCLPISWTQLRRGRAALHLGFALFGLLPLAALAIRDRDPDLENPYVGPGIAALALLIPLWPLVCTLIAPLCWRIGAWCLLLLPVVAAGTLGLIAWLSISSASSAGALLASAGIGMGSLALLPFACAIGSGVEQAPNRIVIGAVPPGTPPPPLLLRLWRLIAVPVSVLPPIPRALLLGLWLRPLYVYTAIVLPALCGVLGATPDGAALLGVIAISSTGSLQHIGSATLGGLLSRRVGLAALTLPPLVIFSLSYFGSMLVKSPSVSPITIQALVASEPWTRQRRIAFENAQVRLARPSGDAFRIADGSTMHIDDWLRRRADTGAQILDPARVATMLALAIERDDSLHLDPARLVGQTHNGAADIRTDQAVDAERCSALATRRALYGLATLAASAIVLALSAPGRATHRRVRRTRVPLAILMALGLAIIASVLWRLLPLDPRVPIDLGMPTPELTWLEALLSTAVAHAIPVAAGLAVVTMAGLASAWTRARWLPLVPEAPIRLA